MLYEYNETQNLFLKVVNGKSELKEVSDLLAYFFQCIGESHRNFPHMQNFFKLFHTWGTPSLLYFCRHSHHCKLHLLSEKLPSSTS